MIRFFFTIRRCGCILTLSPSFRFSEKWLIFQVEGCTTVLAVQHFDFSRKQCRFKWRDAAFSFSHPLRKSNSKSYFFSCLCCCVYNSVTRTNAGTITWAVRWTRSETSERKWLEAKESLCRENTLNSESVGCFCKAEEAEVLIFRVEDSETAGPSGLAEAGSFIVGED